MIGTMILIVFGLFIGIVLLNLAVSILGEILGALEEVDWSGYWVLWALAIIVILALKVFGVY